MKNTIIAVILSVIAISASATDIVIPVKETTVYSNATVTVTAKHNKLVTLDSAPAGTNNKLSVDGKSVLVYRTNQVVTVVKVPLSRK